MAADSGKGEVLSTKTYLQLSQGVPTFGNFCGPGWTGGGSGKIDDPVIRMPGADGLWRESPVDLLCQKHDAEYEFAKGRPDERQLILAANLRLLMGVKELPWHNLNSQEAAYATMMAVAFTAKLAADAPSSVFERAMNELYQQLKQRSTPQNNEVTYEDSFGNTVTIRLDGSPDFLLVSEEGAAEISMSIVDESNIKLTTFGYGSDGKITFEATAVLASSGEINVTVSGTGAVVKVDDANVVLLANASATVEGSHLDITVADGADLDFVGNDNVVSLDSETSINGTGADNALFFAAPDTDVTMNGVSMNTDMDGVVFDASNNMLAASDIGGKVLDNGDKKRLFPALRRLRKEEQCSLQYSVTRMKDSMAQFQLASAAPEDLKTSTLSLEVSILHSSLALAASHQDKLHWHASFTDTPWKALAAPEPGATWFAFPQR
jgi:hypothetical protein